VIVWTRALYIRLVVRDSRTIRRSPQNLCPGLGYTLVADRTGGQDGLLGTLVVAYLAGKGRREAVDTSGYWGLRLDGYRGGGGWWGCLCESL